MGTNRRSFDMNTDEADNPEYMEYAEESAAPASDDDGMRMASARPASNLKRPLPTVESNSDEDDDPDSLFIPERQGKGKGVSEEDDDPYSQYIPERQGKGKDISEEDDDPYSRFIPECQGKGKDIAEEDDDPYSQFIPERKDKGKGVSEEDDDPYSQFIPESQGRGKGISEEDEDPESLFIPEGKAKGKGKAKDKGKGKATEPKKVRWGPIAEKTPSKRASLQNTRFSHLAAMADEDDNIAASSTANPPRGTEYSRDTSDSLFVDSEEEEMPLVGVDKTTVLPRQNLYRQGLTMDSLDRFHAMKEELEQRFSYLQPQDKDKETSRIQRLQEDAETQLVVNLRLEHDMKWAEIVEYINEERRNNGITAELTESAAYSRFVIGTTQVAYPVYEIGFHTKDYDHLRNPTQHTQTEGTGTVSKVARKRTKSFNNAAELKGNVRHHVPLEDHDELETVERMEQMIDAVATVERNFWVFVADEMERITTKLYLPEELARRFHAL